MNQKATASVSKIRQARAEESDLLTQIAIRSKGYWGFDEAFMAGAKEVLNFRASEFLPEFHVCIPEVEEKPAGFCSLRPVDGETILLNDLFIEPHQIGKGYGKQLWEHATNLARTLGFKKVVFTSDPNAEPFYRRQGAVCAGNIASPYRSGRRLPVMEFRVDEQTKSPAKSASLG